MMLRSTERNVVSERKNPWEEYGSQPLPPVHLPVITLAKVKVRKSAKTRTGEKTKIKGKAKKTKRERKERGKMERERHGGKRNNGIKMVGRIKTHGACLLNLSMNGRRATGENIHGRRPPGIKTMASRTPALL